MKRNIIFLALTAMLLVTTSCKKDKDITQGTGNDALLQDGPMSPTLGKLINFKKYGYGRNVFWGRNSDELFLNADTSLLRIDLRAGQIENLGNYGVTGKTNENGAIILSNSYKPNGGYYLYHFNTNKLAFLFPVAINMATMLHIANNNYFYFAGKILPDQGCTDFFCIPGPTIGEATFYHSDFATNISTDLKGMHFYKFSKDGTTALLNVSGYYPIYIYDIATRQLTDSIMYNGQWRWGYYYDEALISFESTISDEVFIKKLKTGQVLHHYQSQISISEDTRFSTDGTKIYYSGGIVNANKMIVAMFDMVSGQEKILLELPYGNGGSTPVEFFLLSDDNKKMLYQNGNDFYVKELM